MEAAAVTGLNELLYLLSANRHGSWGQFRTAAERLVDPSAVSATDSLPVYHLAALSLRQLGHVEFGTISNPNGWRVAPPVLAGGAGTNQSKGVLCGARLPKI